MNEYADGVHMLMNTPYKPKDRCLGAGCYRTGLTDDWAAEVRKEHGERVKFRNWVNGK